MADVRHHVAVADAPFEPRCEPPARRFLPRRVDPTGRRGPTRGQAGGPRWRRVGPCAYAPVAADPAVPEQRIVEATAHLDGRGAVTGRGALRLAGATYFDGQLPDGASLPVPLALGHGGGRRKRPGIELTYEALSPAEAEVRQGVRTAQPLPALFHELRRPGNPRDAIVAMDMAAAAELVSIRRMRRYAAEHSGRRRSGLVRDALDLASERSRSPAETRLRLIWLLDARLPEPLVNQELFDVHGRVICTPDLLDVEAGLVVEYDGAEHRKARRHSRDVAREEACRRVGLEYCKVTGLDMRSTDRVVDRLQSTRSRARFLASGARSWTVVPPAGRSRPESLDDKLDRQDWIDEQLRLRMASPPPGS